MIGDERDDLDDALGWEALAIGLAPAEPEPASAALRRRLLASAAAPSARFAPFFDRLAALLDVGAERAAELLRGLADPGVWTPMTADIALVHLAGGPAVAGADVGFVRVAAGARFPLHHHLGSEAVLVLQGALVDDDGGRARAGDLVNMSGGTSHSFVAEAGEPLLYAVVVFGVEIPGITLPGEAAGDTSGADDEPAR